MPKNKFFLICAVILACVPSVLAREHVAWARTADSFYNRVMSNPFAIVLFYIEDKNDSDWHEQIKQLIRAYKVVSDSTYYKQARLRFVAVDIGKKGMQNLNSEYGVTEVPAFVLFKGGVPVRNAQRQVVVLNGFATPERIKSFIKKYLQQDLEEQLRLESERREEERSYYGGSAYFGFGYDPYYPYYYGNYGYPYGYYGNYYAPGIGFGVSVPF